MPCLKNRRTNDRLVEVSAIRDGGRFPNAPASASSWLLMEGRILGSGGARWGGGEVRRDMRLGRGRGPFGEPTYLCRPTGYRAARDQTGAPFVAKWVIYVD